jgi:hypothetical protein
LLAYPDSEVACAFGDIAVAVAAVLAEQGGSRVRS